MQCPLANAHVSLERRYQVLIRKCHSECSEYKYVFICVDELLYGAKIYPIYLLLLFFYFILTFPYDISRDYLWQTSDKNFHLVSTRVHFKLMLLYNALNVCQDILSNNAIDFLAAIILVLTYKECCSFLCILSSLLHQTHNSIHDPGFLIFHGDYALRHGLYFCRVRK